MGIRNVLSAFLKSELQTSENKSDKRSHVNGRKRRLMYTKTENKDKETCVLPAGKEIHKTCSTTAKKGNSSREVVL